MKASIRTQGSQKMEPRILSARFKRSEKVQTRIWSRFKWPEKMLARIWSSEWSEKVRSTLVRFKGAKKVCRSAGLSLHSGKTGFWFWFWFIVVNRSEWSEEMGSAAIGPQWPNSEDRKIIQSWYKKLQKRSEHWTSLELESQKKVWLFFLWSPIVRRHLSTTFYGLYFQSSCYTVTCYKFIRNLCVQLPCSALYTCALTF